MRNWKKRWNQELNSVIPPLTQDATPVAPGAAAKRPRPSSKRVFSMVGSMAAMLALCIAIGFSLWKPAPFAPTPDESSVTFVSVEINPSACFLADETGVVTDVIATNQDADVIFCDQARMDSLVGIPLSQALQKFTDYAAEFGYLNLTDGDAVRITMCEGGKEALFLDAKEGLTTYLRESGILAAVIDKTSALEDFCAANGMNFASSLDDLKNTFDDLSSLFSERDAHGKTVDELTEEYKTNVLSKQLLHYLEKAYTDIGAKVELLNAINEANNAIVDHADNEHSLDYWALNIIHTHPSPALQELLSTIEDLIWNYKNDYGTDLINSILFYAEYAALTGFPLDELEMLLADFTVDNCLANPALLSEIFLFLELDEVLTTHLTSLPASQEDYNLMVKQALENEAHNRKETHKEEYQQTRPSISEEDYFSHLEGIRDQYGSLDHYFDEIKGNEHHKE